MSARGAILGSALFVLVGPALEAGVGPWLLTGMHVGDDLPGWWALRAAGAALVLAGLTGLVGALSHLAVEGRGTPSPAAPTHRLVIRGVYRHARHPMYVATAAIIAGEGLVLRQPVLLAAAAVYLAATATLGRVREEPLLEARFGDAYREYRDAVPGWWPRLRPYAPERGRPGRR